MCSTLSRAALAASLLVLAAVPARAESVTVRVPFPFMVEGRSFPAGRYQIEPQLPDPSTILIRGAQGRSQVFVLTLPAEEVRPATDKPALTFVRREQQYELSDIWDPGQPGREVPSGAH